MMYRWLRAYIELHYAACALLIVGGALVSGILYFERLGPVAFVIGGAVGGVFGFFLLVAADILLLLLDIGESSRKTAEILDRKEREEEDDPGHEL